MCEIVAVVAHQRWRCEEAYRAAKVLAKATRRCVRYYNDNSLTQDEKHLCEFIKEDSELDPPQTKWWLGAARQSANRLYKERK